MPRKYFTEEEIESLKKNPYVSKVSEKSIQFTTEFKQKLLQEAVTGASQSFILKKLGFDSAMFGKKRMNTLFKRTRDQSKRPEKFETIKSRGRPKKPEFSTLEEENEYLRNRMEYLEQENEFLKKLEALERRDSKSYAPKKSSK